MEELLNRLMIRLWPGVVGIAVADWESGKSLKSAAPDVESQDILDETVSMVALRLRARMSEQRGASPDDDVEGTVLVTRQYYQIACLMEKDEQHGLFAFCMLHRDLGNFALADHGLRLMVQQLSLTPEDKNILSRSRREAWSDGSSALRADASRPSYRFAPSFMFERDADDDDELPAFMREDSVLRLLGVTSDAEEPSLPVTP